MTMKPLSEVLASMPSELPTVPVRPVAAVVTEQDTQVVAKLFEQLKVIFPAWQRASPNPEMQARALREWTVALVEANIKTDDQRKLAEAYLNFLYTPEAQAIIFKDYYRGWDTSKAAPEDVARFPQLELRDIASFGGWKDVQAKHFADGGVFDQIYVGQ